VAPAAGGPVEPATPGDGPGALAALVTGIAVTWIGLFGLRRAARRDEGASLVTEDLATR
jgi:hypothetical protein